MDIQPWLATHSQMLGVIATAIVLGSWLVQNIVAERLKALRDSVARAETDRELNENLFRIHAKLLEVYQVAASARQYSADARSRQPTFIDELYQDVEMLERVGVTRDFALLSEMYAGNAIRAIHAIKPPKQLRLRVDRAVEE